MNRRECLEAAVTAVCFTRNASYGDPSTCFNTVAELWSAVGFQCAGSNVTAGDVALAMILLKVARQSCVPKDDNWVDIAGYAACGAEMENADQIKGS